MPPSLLIAAAGALLLVGSFAGWTVRDWKADSEALKGLKTAITTVEKQRSVIDKAASAYEQEKQDGGATHEIRTNQINTIYRTLAVAADCAAPAALSSVLDAAILAANARAAGQPPAGLPTATPATLAAD